MWILQEMLCASEPKKIHLLSLKMKIVSVYVSS